MPHFRFTELDFLIVRTLLSQPLHAYRLHRELSGVPRSTLYHRLRKLRGLGVLSATFAYPEKAPRRTCLRVSPQGKRLLSKLLTSQQAELLAQDSRLNRLRQQRLRQAFLLAALQALVPPKGSSRFRIPS